MRSRKLSIGSVAICASAMITVLAMGASANAQQEKVLYNFGPTPDGNAPLSSLLFDSAGNLYGTADAGGLIDEGAVFELRRGAGGASIERVIHSFGLVGKDGYSPWGNLIFDKAGNLYGTTAGGGAHNYGTVFELTPTASGWTETILLSFDGLNGASPRSGLIFDKSGNLYGTTYYGGSTSTACDPFVEGCGTVFELIHKPGGTWAGKVLHAFNRDGTDGTQLIAGVIFDAAGNLYGLTQDGGSADGGIAFELTPGPGGIWTESLLHTFLNNGVDGYNSQGGLIFDAAGNLYGTTGGGGGTSKRGTVFELTPASDGSWTETILYAFNDNGSDGIIPYGSVIFDEKGSLYGVTGDGGTHGGGTAFELTPGAGSWTETLLHSFGSGPDGQYPNNSLILDRVGNLYGTTQAGGTEDGCDFFTSCGTVFEITP
jgi:uncharacterized repeat protein (TIGR03803 family)